MEILRYKVPFDYKEVVSLWASVFGEQEALLEKPQVDGAEQNVNEDIVYLAKENNELLGAIHITIPKNNRSICGLSGMCTTTSARGKGLGRILFSKIVDEIKTQNVKTAFLGTNNPIASKLYSSFGFSYVAGSFVMARFSDGDLIDFTKENYSKTINQIIIKNGSPEMRIPIIPLALNLNGYTLLDINTQIFSRQYLTQKSCMGLFLRYLSLKDKGGNYYGAYNEKGVLGAVLSVMPTSKGMRADFFNAKNFENAILPLLTKCEENTKNVYLEILETDKEKQAIALRLGFKYEENSTYIYDNALSFKTKIYRK